MADNELNIFDLMRSQREMFQNIHWEGTFDEFVAQKLSVNPYQYTRTAYQYMYDMLQYFGTEEIEDSGESLLKYRLFDDPFDEGLKPIFGMERTLDRLVRYIKSAALEEGKERIFVLHGPVGTAKTSLIDLLGRGLDHYSRTSGGEALTFSWRLPKDYKDEQRKVGFGSATRDDGDKEIFASIRSQFRDNPVLLIPKQVRREYLQSLFKKYYGAKPFVMPCKLLDGSLDYNSSQIYNYLMAEFKGDWERVLKLVRVERFSYSEVEGIGIGKIHPEGNVETSASLITIDENFKHLATLLSNLNLVKFNGKYAMGNRGLIHYSDIFKKPVPYLQHLLAACEEHKMDFGDITSGIDVIIMATTNSPEYDEFRKNPISRGLRSRMRKIDVPYLLVYAHEEKIYNLALHQARKRRHVMPHTTRLAAMWAVLTRLVKSQQVAARDIDDATKSTLRKLTPMVKLYLYNNEFHPSLSSQDKERLTKAVRKRIRNEFQFEGMEGCPTRILQNLLADICEMNTDRCISPFDVFTGLEKIIDQGGINYDFLLRKPEEGFHDFTGFVDELRRWHQDAVTVEVENSILELDEEELDNKIRQYLQHVKAYNSKEKVFNKTSGKDEEPSERIMRAVEDRMEVADGERDEHRFKALTRATAAAQVGKPLELRKVYRDLFDAVQKNLYEEKKSQIRWPLLKMYFEKSLAGQDTTQIDKQVHRQAGVLVENLAKKHNYCPLCAKEIVLYVIKVKQLDR